MSSSGITTTESQDRVAIQSTVRTTPIPIVFLVNIDAKIIGMKASKLKP